MNCFRLRHFWLWTSLISENTQIIWNILTTPLLALDPSYPWKMLRIDELAVWGYVIFDSGPLLSIKNTQSKWTVLDYANFGSGPLLSKQNT